VCLQELAALGDMLVNGHAVDGTYVVQGYIATGLQRRGHDVTFLAPLGTHEVEFGPDPSRPARAPRSWSDQVWFDVASRAAWRLQQLAGVPYLNVFSNYRLLDACLQCLPGHDVVYERNGLYTVGVAQACRRLNLPYVMFFEADQLFELEYAGRPVTGLLRWRAEQVLRQNLAIAATVICVSEAARQQLLARWDVPPAKVTVCPNGVNVQRFRPGQGLGTHLRAAWGLGRGPLLLFVGSFFDWHDVPTALAAFARVLEAHPDARLVFVGDGPTRRSMEQQARDLGVAHATHFAGLIGHDQVPAVVAAADVALAPYPALDRALWHSPLKLYEYLASGIAVIASRTGQVGEVVHHERNGLLVPPGDVHALAESMTRLLGDAALRQRLGRQAREDAVREHSWDRYLERLEGVFARAIDGTPGRVPRRSSS
jgi:glycosyltransferase involved in cell wall biosynthesis